eukprot:Hpha_TRINITY_DN16087_c4_g1::TRINITY_DN16087_c4_g1_i8::g.118641::m.118641
MSAAVALRLPTTYTPASYTRAPQEGGEGERPPPSASPLVGRAGSAPWARARGAEELLLLRRDEVAGGGGDVEPRRERLRELGLGDGDRKDVPAAASSCRAWWR